MSQAKGTDGSGGSTKISSERSLSIENAKKYISYNQRDVDDVNILYSVGINPDTVLKHISKASSAIESLNAVGENGETVDDGLAQTESNRFYYSEAAGKSRKHVSDVSTDALELASALGKLDPQEIINVCKDYNYNLQCLKVNLRLRLLQNTAQEINDAKIHVRESETVEENKVYQSDIRDEYFIYKSEDTALIYGTVNEIEQKCKYHTVSNAHEEDCGDGYKNTYYYVTTHKYRVYFIDYDSFFPSRVDDWAFFGLLKMGDMKIEKLEELIQRVPGYSLPYNPEECRDADAFID